MSEGAYRAVPITNRVFWVGAIDWGLRDFHGYLTSRGSTYNAYLITGEEPVLIDTVKAPFREEMMARIASVLDPSDIRCIVSNHAEMDHTGSLPEVIAEVRPDRVVASKAGVKALRDHFHWDQEVQTVADGERLELGGTSLRFFEARMLHWPDSMFTFFESEGVLFTNDAFGMHLASAERFVDEIDPCTTRYEAAKYYANILLPFSPLVRKLLGRVPAWKLDLQMIAPDHGPVWRRDPGQILELYDKWAAQPYGRKAVVVYDTMWESTARMATAVGEGLAATGLHVVLMPLRSVHRSDVATEVLEAGALVLGSPTMNGEVLPPLADVTTYLRGLKPQRLVAAAFGSYGWSGEAVAKLAAVLEEMKLEAVANGVRVRYVPDAEALQACRDLGTEVGRRLGDRLAASANGGN